MHVLLLAACSLVSEADLASRLDLDGDGVVRPDDCDDDDANVTGRVWFADDDGDGWGSGEGVAICNAGGGYVETKGDCNDGDSAVTPDNVWYADNDGDGRGDLETATAACEPPEGHVASAGDCDDACVLCYDGAVEACGDAVDNDCDGVMAGECALTGDIHLGSAHATLRGEEGEVGLAKFGLSLAFSDHLGDGADEVVVGGACGAYVFGGPVSGVLGSASVPVLAGSSCGNAHSVATGGDFTGDGADDLVIAIGYAPPYLYSNMTTIGVLITTVFAFDGGGDLDGDSFADVVIASYGELDIFAGPLAGGMPPEAARARVAIAEFDPPAPVAWVGDTDGDGGDDIVFSRPYGGDDRGDGYHGEAYVVPGSALQIDATWTSDAPCYLGLAIDGAGDTDGDGYADVIVGSWTCGVWVVRGPLAGGEITDLAVATLVVESTEGGAVWSAVAGAGDTNGDERADLLIGDRNYGDNEEGAAYLVRGPVEGSISLADADARLLGETSGDLAGAAVAGGGDTNDDGFADILVGAPGNNVGAVYVLYGGS